MPVYNLTQYIAIIRSEYYNGRTASAKKYFQLYKENGGGRTFAQIMQGYGTKAQMQAKKRAKMKKTLKKWFR